MRSPWIISPAWDLLLFVATPVLIVPAVLWLERFLSAPQIWLLVISFCSVGHHLPGFLRAYGDPALFGRFRWRLLIVPPLLLATCLLFEWYGFIGLKVVIVLWATWHGLMQTYGFMRIYDAKRGITDRWNANLDFWLCVLLFVSGTVFSEARTFDLLRRMWESGVPVFGLEWLMAVRWIVAVATVGVVAVYLFHLLRHVRDRQVSGNKVLLAVSTGGIWWLCGARGIDPLIGVAMFEIYHAVQYLAIVWVTGRKWMSDLGGDSPSWQGFVRRRWLLLSAYLGLIALYGGIHHFSVIGLPGSLAHWSYSSSGEAAEAAGGGLERLLAILPLALLGTSTLLHYYFDGFIWKVRERHLQESLAIDGGPGISRLVPGLLHTAKWACFFLPLGILLGLEALHRQQPPSARAQQQAAIATTLARYSPNCVQAHLLEAKTALRQGDVIAATAACQRAIQLDEGAAEAHAVQGNIWEEMGQLTQAIASYRQAATADPANRAYLSNLAGALRDAGHWEEAEQRYRQLQDLAANPEEVNRDLGTLYGLWGIHLLGQKHTEPALTRLRQALEYRPDWAEVHYRLGLVYLEEHQSKPAEAALQAAVQHDPHHSGAHYRLATLAHLRGEHSRAVEHYRACVAAKPDFAEAWSNLGATFAQLGKSQQAEDAYRQAIAHHPELAEAHFNLALVLWNRVSAKVEFGLTPADASTLRAAKEHLLAARERGYQVPLALWQAIGSAAAEVTRD